MELYSTLHSELEATFQGAVGALQCEEASDPSGALSQYYVARSRIRCGRSQAWG